MKLIEFIFFGIFCQKEYALKRTYLICKIYFEKKMYVKNSFKIHFKDAHGVPNGAKEHNLP